MRLSEERMRNNQSNEKLFYKRRQQDKDSSSVVTQTDRQAMFACLTPCHARTRIRSLSFLFGDYNNKNKKPFHSFSPYFAEDKTTVSVSSVLLLQKYTLIS
jgi:hypothetical protein